MAYISQMTVLEDGEVDPWTFFPSYVMKAVDYGIALGLECHVMRYRLANSGAKVGVIMSLYAGEREIGNYVTKI